jgi:hypothetical protein
LDYFSAIEFTVKYNDWKDSADPMIRTFMRRHIYNYITSVVSACNLTVKCDLPSKVCKIEEILFSQLSLNFEDFYDPATLLDRMRMAIKIAGIDKIVVRQLNKIAMEYDVSKQNYEKLFYLHKIRSLIDIFVVNKIRQGDFDGYMMGQTDISTLSNTICKIFASMSKKEST